MAVGASVHGGRSVSKDLRLLHILKDACPGGTHPLLFPVFVSQFVDNFVNFIHHGSQ